MRPLAMAAAAQIRVCLEHGITNILCEKALVTSVAEAREIRALVAQHDARHARHLLLSPLPRHLLSEIGLDHRVRVSQTQIKLHAKLLNQLLYLHN